MQVAIVSEVEINKGRLCLSFNGYFLDYKVNIIFIEGKSISLNKGDVVIIKGIVKRICGKALFIEPQNIKILFEEIN
ncbi:MAG: hypothetical protein COW00_06490 [Bdellovibrio sp. CG12_big_fil_rev_8_21_14_0_65_39_13]|nr:MAG: hypothetical protein COW78_19025 [Bdellovibrio sp. CG22_combo_CG10-13_8_21_14_all_39_27]PIQ60869.1 MAG: hypothetical protein COW00_06490 [Bdellovibrio sp. CG12_big_fil_rev_8_21_14_0_65_39_13]PIR36493.1 MAG: hypothetical protein COV37_03835 [Bdellovibrio sp. CG11_big_fil_rev_8_21_14_0_20_39_38]PJB54159.1 MAG: hypothetical protein CO099_03120 [Bdellovibrio sp. CG_4_9_14_3_um_filter_39_7]